MSPEFLQIQGIVRGEKMVLMSFAEYLLQEKLLWMFPMVAEIFPKFVRRLSLNRN